MKLQISFDLIDLQKALQVAAHVAPHCDILEVGTLLIYHHGLDAIRQFKEQFQEKTILADSKIIDRGKQAATLLAQANPDWITVMAGTSKNVIHATCTAAHNKGKKVMIDLLDSKSVGQSAMEAKNLGADALLFHEPYDEEHSLVFLDKWDMVHGNTDLPIFISAKITRDNIDEILRVKPAGIIIGNSITQAQDPAKEAAFFYQLIKTA